MSQGRMKCIIILSSKSSGSSALQNLLAMFSQVNHVSKTRHFQNETLFWTKAASILGLPQVKMLDSEVPISQEKAKVDLINLLRDNLNSYTLPKDNEEFIFYGWKMLCKQYSPIFLEKSPHHLLQWSALELIMECIKRFPEIDFLIIGLVRNPMDELYSEWRRWKTIPEKNQYQWLTAYYNLLKFKDLTGYKMVIIRYEDMVNDSSCLKKVFKFIGTTEDYNNDYLHARSIGKWKKDKFYGFKLSEEVINLAEKYGYSRQELIKNNNKKRFWLFYRYLLRSIHKSMKPIKSTLRPIKSILLNNKG